MKILMLNYEYPPLGGGGAAVCRDISEKMVHRGHIVTVITMCMDGLKTYEIINGVHIHRVKCWRKKEKVCHPWEQMTYCISAFNYINNNLNIDAFDVIHCHFIIPTGLLAYWIKRKYRKDYILTAQGSDVIGHNNKRFKLLYSVIKPGWVKIVDNAKVLTAPSEYLIDKIHKTTQKQCILIPNGLCLKDYYTSEKKKIIITLCRLQESKGIQDLIIALSKVNLNGWKAYILGDGPYKKELLKMIDEYGLSNQVNILGYVSDEERTRFLSEAGLYFTGSWFEAMPISVLEAMASSCNIIASDIEPHNSVLDTEYIYKDMDDLKHKLENILKAEPHSINYNINQYDWDNIIDDYERIY